MLNRVGVDGTGRYPDSSGHETCQFGWNRGSFKLSSLFFRGGGFLLFLEGFPCSLLERGLENEL